MKIRQAICIPMTKPREMAVDAFLSLVHDIGFPAVEVWGRDANFDAVVQSCNRLNLRLVSMCGHNSLGDGLNKRQNHDRIEAELRESIRVANDLGMPGIICFSGNRRADQSHEDAIAATAEGLLRVADFAAEKNVNLNVELLNTKKDHKGYDCDSTNWGLELCQRAQHPRVKLLYDIYHMQIMEGNVIQTIRDNIAHIGHFHTAGVPGRGNIDDSQELNYPAICRAISESSYDGFVGHEFRPTGDLEQTLRDAFKRCDVKSIQFKRR